MMKLFIVEELPILWEHVQNRCAAVGGWEVVGQSGTVGGAISLLPDCKPDIILLDIELADGEGFTVAEYARSMWPAVGFLILTGHLNEHTLAQCQRLHVRGFVDKFSACTQVLDDALRALAKGKTYFSAAYLAAKRTWLADSCAISKRLSDTEMLVLRLVTRGLSDAEIGLAQTITEMTAKTHRSSILRKLGLAGTPKLMAHACERSFGDTHW